MKDFFSKYEEKTFGQKNFTINSWLKLGPRMVINQWKDFFWNEKLNAVKCLLIRNHSDDTKYKINLTT